MLKRPHYLALGAVLALVLIVLNLPSRLSLQLKLALSSLFLPLFGLAGSAQHLGEQAGNAVTPRRILHQEIEQLRRENQDLRLRAQQAEALWHENNLLRPSLGWQKQAPWKLKAAQVVGRDPANWWRTIHIDLGTRDGVRADLPVLTPDGLVGRVALAGFAHSQVVLVGDPNCRVAALVEETRDHGILGPAASAEAEPAMVDLTYLSGANPLRPGQRIVTSGLGGIFPKGIRVGEIVETRSVGHGLYLEARVRLAVNFSRLETVWVMLP